MFVRNSVAETAMPENIAPIAGLLSGIRRAMLDGYTVNTKALNAEFSQMLRDSITRNCVVRPQR